MVEIKAGYRWSVKCLFTEFIIEINIDFNDLIIIWVSEV